jgi:hypothetical protein
MRRSRRVTSRHPTTAPSDNSTVDRAAGPLTCQKSCVFGQRHHREPRDAKSGACAVTGNSVFGQAQGVSTTLGVCETVSDQMTESQAERAKPQWIEKINQHASPPWRSSVSNSSRLAG